MRRRLRSIRLWWRRRGKLERLRRERGKGKTEGGDGARRRRRRSREGGTRSPLESAKSGKLERLRQERGKGKSMRGSAPRWRRLRRKRWRRREKWKRGWSVNATSAVTKAEGVDVEVGGTIGRQGATLPHVVVVGGGMEGVLHQGEEDLRQDVGTLLQGEV